MSSVALTIPARQRDIGDTNVRRSLPYAKQRMVGPFIFWDHMGPRTVTEQSPLAVKSHPHIGLSTLTYLFQGEMLHRDSVGNEQIIRPGEVNWMTAGRGIAHSERTMTETPMTLEGLQIWVALPTHHESMAPTFQHVEVLPTVTFGGHEFCLLAGEFDTVRSPVNTYSKLICLDGQFQQDSHLTVPAINGYELALYIAKGGVVIEGNEYSEGDMLVLFPDQETQVDVPGDSRLLILGGEPLPEQRHIWWNFVASDQALIDAAKSAWHNGEFAPVINETERLPLPKI